VVGIMGTAIAGPKGTFLAESEANVEFRIPALWVLPTSLAAGLKSPQGDAPHTEAERRYDTLLAQLNQEINRQLLVATDWHRYLLDRVGPELEKIGIPRAEIEATIRMMGSAEKNGDPQPMILLDRIFSLEPALWDRFLRLFVSLKDRSANDPAWKALLQEVSERLRTR